MDTPFEDCIGEDCHCKGVAILALLVGRQKVCPACDKPLKVDFKETTLVETPLPKEDKLVVIPVHLSCVEKVLEVRDAIIAYNRRLVGEV